MKHTNSTQQVEVYITTYGKYEAIRQGVTVSDFGAHVGYYPLMIFAAVAIIDLEQAPRH